MLTLLLLLATVLDPAPPRPGRIILVSMDTVRADFVGAAEQTPELARLAAEGARCRRSYAASTYTLPSTMSMLTGLHPEEHGVLLDFARLNPEVPTLAGELARAGYRTQAFHEGGYAAARFGFDAGFAEYRELPRLGLVQQHLPEILDWVRRQGREPYFLFLHTYAAHFPYGGLEDYRRRDPQRGLPTPAEVAALRRQIEAGQVPDLDTRQRARFVLYNHLVERHEDLVPFRDRHFGADFPDSEHFEPDLAAVRRSYAHRIRAIDGAVGQLRALLEELDLWQDTLLVVTSDHGEAFYEHGLQRHDYVPYDEVLRVPLLISFPARLAVHAPRVVDDLVWHLDLVPTLLAAAGATRPGDLSGVDLWPVLTGAAPASATRRLLPVVLRPAHYRQKPPRHVLLQGASKLIEGPRFFGDPAGLLFDLGADPGERRNLREREAERFRDLRRLLRADAGSFTRRDPVHQTTGQPLGDGSEAQPVELTPAQRAALEALGYLEPE